MILKLSQNTSNMPSSRKKVSEFNIRVYGLVINPGKEILLTDEYRLEQYMTKFPGGGLEKGEGTVDCLRREFMEEMQQKIYSISHYYTTDFYQKGWFYENMQLISIYYKAQLERPEQLPKSKKKFDFITNNENPQSFRWASIKNLNEDELTFPIDRVVLKMLKQELVDNY